MDIIGKIEDMITPFLEEIPFQKFLISSEVVILLFLSVTWGLSGSLGDIFYSIEILAFMIIFSISVLFLLFDYSIDMIGAAAALFILAGVFILAIQIEGIVGRGTAYMTNIFFMANAVLLIIVGGYMIKTRVGKIRGKALKFFFWNFSLLVLIYIPLSKLYFPRTGFGFGGISAALIGIPLSVFSFVSFLSGIRREDKLEETLIKAQFRRLLDDLSGAERSMRDGMTDSSKITNEFSTALADLYLQKGDYPSALKHYVRSEEYGEGRNLSRASMIHLLVGDREGAYERQKEALETEQTPSRWYWMGRIYSELGDLKNEKDSYERAIELDDEYFPAFVELADLEEENRTSHLVRALKAGPHTDQKHTILRKLNAVGGFAPVYLHPADTELWKKAGNRCNEMVQSILLENILGTVDIGDPDLWRESRKALKDIGDGSYQRFEGDSREVSEVRALFMAAENEFKRALKELERLDEDASPWAKFLDGILKAIVGDYDGSIKELKNIDDGDLKLKAMATVGTVNHLKGELEEAKRYLKDAVWLGYRTPAIRENIMDSVKNEYEYIYLKSQLSAVPVDIISGRPKKDITDIVDFACYGETQSAFQVMQSMDVGGSIRGRLIKGTIQTKRGEYVSALEIFNDLVEDYPDLSEARLGKGICLLNRGQFRNALDSINKALEIEGKDPLYVFYRGRVYHEWGRKIEARDEFQKVKDLDPGWGRNMYYLLGGE